jgi:hypothetical protein
LNEYNMYRPVVTGATTRPASFPSAASATPVVATLLGVRVTAYVVIRSAEHRRRETAGLGAVINPALLDRLIDLPAAMPVSDPVLWAEMAEQPPGILERSGIGTRVTRRLESPLSITDVVVDAVAGKELRAVQDASLFAGFTRRWVATARGHLPPAAMLEAKLYGVGVLAPGQRVVLPAEKPAAPTVDGWSWLLEEKAYRRWLSRPAGNRAQGSRGPATGGASGWQGG